MAINLNTQSQESLQRLLQTPLNLPPIALQIKRCDDGLVRVFDRLRNKFVALTPEERVRQHFVDYLINNYGYPASLMANEIALKFNGQMRRCDTVLFARGDLSPQVIVEYKAPEIEITQKVFDQIARYNMVMEARLLIVSNGLRHFCCLYNRQSADGPTYRFLRDIPSYADLQML